MDRLLTATFLAERDHFWFHGLRRFAGPLIERGLAGATTARGDGRPRILDCGCGTGANLALLSRYGEVYGFDLTPLGLRFARAHGNQRVARASITHLPFRSSAFDLVTSFDVLQCLTATQETLAVAELARVLKPGGALLLNVAALDVLRGSHALLSEEVRRYRPAMLRAAAARAGLVVERLTFTNASLFPILVATRTAQRAIGLTPGEHNGREIAVPMRPINTLFRGLLSLEARLLRWMNMPIGSSLLCLARKPSEDADAHATLRLVQLPVEGSLSFRWRRARRTPAGTAGVNGRVPRQ